MCVSFFKKMAEDLEFMRSNTDRVARHMSRLEHRLSERIEKLERLLDPLDFITEKEEKEDGEL